MVLAMSRHARNTKSEPPVTDKSRTNQGQFWVDTIVHLRFRGIIPADIPLSSLSGLVRLWKWIVVHLLEGKGIFGLQEELICIAS